MPRSVTRTDSPAVAKKAPGGRCPRASYLIRLRYSDRKGSDMRWLLLAAVLSQTPALQAQEPPPAYPRAGATTMLENERVLVWNISWLQQEYPVHRHLYDHVGVYYASGDRLIISTDGSTRPVSTPAWNISFQLRGVTHAEAGTSEEPLRAVFIQIKDEPRQLSGAPGAGRAFPVDGPLQRLDNDRTTVWEYAPDSPHRDARHRHTHDAVVVSFDATPRPQVRYVERGTVHETDGTAGSTRTFVFEIK